MANCTAGENSDKDSSGILSNIISNPGISTVKATKRTAEDEDVDGVELEPPKKAPTSVSDIVSRSKDRKQIMLGGAMKKKPIKLNFGLQKSKEEGVTVSRNQDDKVKAVFNDDDSDEEEMPPEAKMRMRNLGRDTPTSCGPNSFGKGKLGFLDRRKVYEREMVMNQKRVSEERR